VHEALGVWHSTIVYIRLEIDESILLLIEIVNSKSLTGFHATLLIAGSLREKKSRINARANSKLQSLGAGSIDLLFVPVSEHPHEKYASRRLAFAKIPSDPS
jgi:hypothetical protein